eukprot:scaffold108050_cov78-Phaeocystis_antarctica.AAC.1
MAAESGAFIHAEAVQRKSREYRPGLTNTQTSSRVSPLAITARHRRQRPRPDGSEALAGREMVVPGGSHGLQWAKGCLRKAEQAARVR